MKRDISELPLSESFYSIQGEGYNSGKAAYFIRFGGCNVCCSWCDAKETWNPGRSPLVPVAKIVDMAVESGARSVIITGGEPLMHDLGNLCSILKSKGFEIMLETSGSSPLTGMFDWICLSPKQKRPPLDSVLNAASELKVVIESVSDFKWAEECRMRVSGDCILYLQPEWSKMRAIMPEIVNYVKREPHWHISTQTHKFMNIP